MKYSRRLLALANTVRPFAVRDYAESRGWQRVAGVKGRLWVLDHAEYALRQLHIPMDADTVGFEEAMMDVAARIAEVETRDIVEVLTGLQHPDADILRFRTATPESAGGELPLVDDINLRQGARIALLAAACSVVTPQLHHPRLSRTEAEQLVQSCRAGQTEWGSYVVTIVCPLNPMERPLALPGLDDDREKPLPFTRQVTHLLMEATHQLVESIEADSIDEFLDKNEKSKKLSWNLCDALLRMRPSGRGKIELSVNWAGTPDVPRPTDLPERITLHTEYFPDIQSVCNRLRPVAERQQDQLLIGTVESLHGKVGEDGKRAGEVVLAVFDEESSEIARARVNLTADENDIADEAHMQGFGYVYFRGILRRGPRIGRIDNLRSFKPLRMDAGDEAPG